jgi:nucleoside-diphosphate-sugar epimerase
LAEAALQAGTRHFVLVSSLAARSPLLSAYAASKHAGEREVLRRLGPAKPTILRPPVVYGPGDMETLPMFRAARHGIFPILGPPEARLSFIHVGDLAAAVAACLAAPIQAGGVFEIDDGASNGHGWAEIGAALGAALGRVPRAVQIPRRAVRLAAFAALILARLTGRPLMLRPDKVNELRHPDWVCRDSRLTQNTGWRAKHGLADGFCDAVAWYKAHGLLN